MNVYIALGSNLGNRLANLERARQKIGLEIGPVNLLSPIYETEPWGLEDQPMFLNQVIMTLAKDDPTKILKTLLSIESDMHRHRDQKWGPRTIDLDILMYGDRVINQPGLIIPHPAMQNRRFVLKPLTDIAPDLIHPVFKKTVRQLLETCEDSLNIHPHSG